MDWSRGDCPGGCEINPGPKTKIQAAGGIDGDCVGFRCFPGDGLAVVDDIFYRINLGLVFSLATAYLPAALISSFLPSRMGIVTDRLGRKGPMIAGLLVGSAASLLIPGLRSLAALTVLWAVETIGCTISLPAERAFVADIAGRDIRGKSYGLYTFLFFFGGAVGPLAGGWLYDSVGHAVLFYYNSAVLILGAALVMFVLYELEVQSENLPGNVGKKSNI